MNMTFMVGRVTHGVVGGAPFVQPTINVIFISVNNSSFSNRLFDQGGDRLLLHVREHPDDNLAATLHHAEDRRFLLLQRSSAPFTLQRTPSPGPPLFFNLLGFTLISCHYIDFVPFHFAAERDLR